MPFHPSEYLESIDPSSLRVHRPSSIIFVCGGVTDTAAPNPISLRDCFLRIANSGGLPTHKVVIAEAGAPLQTDAGYSDLFQFENDIAAAVSLILLFSESPGSLAELGAFAALPSVAKRLLAVIDDTYYEQESFVRNGPIRFLEGEIGDESVFRLERAEVGIDADGNTANVNLAALSDQLAPAINERIDGFAVEDSFDNHEYGHIVLLIAGLIYDYGAMKFNEIKEALGTLGIDLSETRLRNLLYCNTIFGWTVKVKKGNNTFYVSTTSERAISFSQKKVGRRKVISDGGVRWRAKFREHWEKADRPRHNAIAAKAANAV